MSAGTAEPGRIEDLITRIGRRLQSRALRLRYRWGLPLAEPGKVAVSTSFRHPVDVSRRTSYIALYRQSFAAACEREREEAARLRTHHIDLLGHPSVHGPHIAWSLDPVSGREWPRVFSPDIVYRGPDRLGDIKLAWELNKHQYFFTLGKLGWLDDDPAYGQEIVRQISDWIDDNPIYTGIHWIGALESGARAISWIMAYPFFADAVDEGFEQRFARSLAQHMMFIERNLSTGRVTNTHLIGEAAALVVGGLFLSCNNSPRWLDLGLSLLNQEVARQVTPDGVHVERSIAYHRFCLDHFYLVMAMLAANGREFPKSTLERVERMTEFLADALYPDGSAPAYCDGDDSRGLWCRADAPTDYHGLIAMGAACFGRGDFKGVLGGVPSEELLWLGGPEAIALYADLPRSTPTHLSATYPGGGYYVLRGGWQPSSPVTVFDCGPLGHGPAAHGHADALSLQVHAAGFPFLVDCGTYSYNLDYRWRDAFRSTRAHNTIVVDACDQSELGDRLSWVSQARSRCRRWVATEWFDLVDGEHDGYRRLADPVGHRRIATVVRPGFWLIVDLLDSIGEHSIESLLHVHPDCRIALDAARMSFTLTAPNGSVLDGRVLANSLSSCALAIRSGTDPDDGVWYSPSYGVRVPGQAVVLQGYNRGPARIVTVLSTGGDWAPSLDVGDSMMRLGIEEPQGGGSHTLRVGLDGSASWNDDEISAVADLVYQNSAGVLWAANVRTVRVPNSLTLHSPRPATSLVLDGDHCAVTYSAEPPRDLDIAVGNGISVTVNGRPTTARTL
ncbi:MAG: alginate lyase family protein [Methylotetracoccus sp.]